jgi:hypothetical protein
MADGITAARAPAAPSSGRRFCPMSTFAPERACVASACPRLGDCTAERRALSEKFNPAMSNEEICRTWPGAHLGVVLGEEPRWVLHQHRDRGCCEPWRAGR